MRTSAPWNFPRGLVPGERGQEALRVSQVRCRHASPLGPPALSALLVFLALVFAFASGEGDATLTPTTVPPEGQSTAPPGDAQPAAPSSRATADPAPSQVQARAEALRTCPTARSRGGVTGLVVDYDSLAAADVEARLLPSFGGLHPLLAIADDRTAPTPVRTAADGTFRFEDVASGPWRAVASAADAREGSAEASAPRLPHEAAVVVTLGRAIASPHFTVIVLEPDAATPVRGAHVAVHRLTDLHSVVDEGEAPFANLTTDDLGRGVLENAPRDPPFVFVRDDAFRVCAHAYDEPAANQPRYEAQIALPRDPSARGCAGTAARGGRRAKFGAGRAAPAVSVP